MNPPAPVSEIREVKLFTSDGTALRRDLPLWLHTLDLQPLPAPLAHTRYTQRNPGRPIPEEHATNLSRWVAAHAGVDAPDEESGTPSTVWRLQLPLLPKCRPASTLHKSCGHPRAGARSV